MDGVARSAEGVCVCVCACVERVVGVGVGVECLFERVGVGGVELM